MKRNFVKRILTCVLTSVLLVGTISMSAFAKDRDFYNTSTSKVYTISDLSDDDFNNFLLDVTENGDNYVYEFGGKYYNYTKIVDDYTAKKNSGLSVVDAFKACMGNSSNIQQGFDASKFNGGTTPDPTTTDFSVTSIE